MAAVELKPVATSGDLVAIARRLGQEFAKHAAEMDETDTFVADELRGLESGRPGRGRRAQGTGRRRP